MVKHVLPTREYSLKLKIETAEGWWCLWIVTLGPNNSMSLQFLISLEILRTVMDLLEMAGCAWPARLLGDSSLSLAKVDCVSRSWG